MSRARILFYVGGIAIFSCGIARADDAEFLARLKAYQNADGTVNADRLNQYLATQKSGQSSKGTSSSKTAAEARSQPTASASSGVPASSSASEGGGKTEPEPGSAAKIVAPSIGWQRPVIRQDIPNWSFDELFPKASNKPEAIKLADGAKLGFNRDNQSNDTTWAVAGTVALPYRFEFGDYGAGNVLASMIAPYAFVDRQRHSKSSAKDVETYAAGMAMMAAIDGGIMTHYLRWNTEIRDNEVKDAQSVSSRLEWEPVSAILPFHYPNVTAIPWLGYSFSPSIVSYYDYTWGDSVSVFSGKEDAWRVGPKLTLELWPLLPADVTDWRSRITGKLSYSTYKEFMSGRGFNYFDASLTYQVDEAGHVGVTTKYSRGTDETKGTNTDQYDVSLRIKF